jgi:hypothetical protein
MKPKTRKKKKKERKNNLIVPSIPFKGRLGWRKKNSPTPCLYT